MLKSVYIDGLKSLRDLTLELQPGLNVLVGPNGSGKTNILTAFELISNLNNIEILNSRGQIGSMEIGELFDVYDRERKIKLRFSGEFDSHVNGGKGKNNRKQMVRLSYEFQCELAYQPELRSKLYFSQQELDLCVNMKKSESILQMSISYKDNSIKIKHYDSEFPLDIEENYSEFMKKVVSSLKKHKVRETSDEYINDGVYKFIKEKLMLEDVLEKSFESKLNERKGVYRFQSLIFELSHVFEPLKSVIEEMESGRAYNIDPDQIRRTINKIDHPVVAYDGTRLLSALLKVCENSNGSKKLTYGREAVRDNYKRMKNTIVAYLKDVLPEATDLDVKYNDAKNEITGYVIFELKNKKRELAIELLSDGSLKWLSLVTILLTKENMFVLEEPENYLHPAMQKFIVELMRESIESKDEIRLFTTHCERILNLINPSEVLLTFYREGRTQVKRIENQEFLKKAIEETGFGIGSQLVSGAFEYEEAI